MSCSASLHGQRQKLAGSDSCPVLVMSWHVCDTTDRDGCVFLLKQMHTNPNDTQMNPSDLKWILQHWASAGATQWVSVKTLCTARETMRQPYLFYFQPPSPPVFLFCFLVSSSVKCCLMFSVTLVFENYVEKSFIENGEARLKLWRRCETTLS